MYKLLTWDLIKQQFDVSLLLFSIVLPIWKGEKCRRIIKRTEFNASGGAAGMYFDMFNVDNILNDDFSYRY